MPDTQKVKIENELVLKGSTAEIKVGDDPQGALVRAIKSSTCRDEFHNFCIGICVSFETNDASTPMSMSFLKRTK